MDRALALTTSGLGLIPATTKNIQMKDLISLRYKVVGKTQSWRLLDYFWTFTIHLILSIVVRQMAHNVPRPGLEPTTHVSRVTPTQDLLKDAQPTELPRRGQNGWLSKSTLQNESPYCAILDYKIRAKVREFKKLKPNQMFLWPSKIKPLTWLVRVLKRIWNWIFLIASLNLGGV